MGIDALENECVRVHLFCNVDALKDGWRGLERRLRQDANVPNVPFLPPEDRIRLYTRDNGSKRRGYFGLEWSRGDGGFQMECENIKRYTEWLRHIALAHWRWVHR
jgi:hypothetical protein